MGTTLVFRGETLAPAAFERRWRQAAALLRSAGVGEGDVVAQMMRNSPEHLEVAVATRHLGAQWCPINWHFKAEELHYVLADCGAKVLVIDAELLPALPPGSMPGLQVFVARGEAPGLPAWAAAREAQVPLEAAAAPPRGPMLYTSGTTGRPKGIRRQPSTPEQQRRAGEVRRLSYGFETGMRALLSAPMYHSAPNAYALGAVLEDGTLYIEERFDAADTLRLIGAHRITHAYLVPTMYVRLLALPAELRARHPVDSVRFVGSTGSPCPPDVKRAMIAWWGPVIHECYGSSELGYMTLLTSEQALRKPGSAGRALDGVTLKILDDEGAELPAGAPGLIYVGQSAVADFTYIGNDDARRAMEVAGLKTMNDIGYLDEEGFLFIVDRKADMVISGGVNIYPVEIEAVLQAMPGVVDCAVFGIPDDEFGESLAAAVQPAPGAALTAEAVREWVRGRMASYKVPRVVSFHDALPREDTGKIFKRRLREPYWEGRSRRV